MNIKNNYDEKTHFYGRLWMIAALLLILAVPLSISIRLDSWPTLGEFLKAYLPILSLFGPIALIEITTYGPMLGNAGTYLGFVTGNLVNLKVPVSMNAINNAKVKAGSEEADVISTIAIGTASITTIFILFIGVISFSQIMPILNSEALAPAFANLLPALFGGIGVVFISKNYKMAVIPVIFALLVFIIYPAVPVGILIPVEAIISLASARYLRKKNLI